MKNSLENLVAQLDQQEKTKKDFISKSNNLMYLEGNLIVTMDNVPITYKPTNVFHSQVSDSLNIPKSYYDRMKTEAVGLLDSNVNHWLKQNKDSKLIRTFENLIGDNNNVARAFLSNSYKVIDNYEILFTALDAIKATGINVEVVEACLSETRMYLKVICPDVEVQARQLLERYSRASQVGYGVLSGLELSNSEVGKGSTSLSPRGHIRACSNGLILLQDSVKKVHLGAKMDELNFDQNKQIVATNVRLIKEQIKHAVKLFLSESYLNKVVNFYTEKGNKEIEAPISNVIEVVAKNYNIGQERKNSILNYFIKGADTRRIGLVNAITEELQTLEDADLRHDSEVIALDMLNNFNAIESQAAKLSSN